MGLKLGIKRTHNFNPHNEKLTQGFNTGIEDWQSITIEDVCVHGGGGLLKNKYNGSLVQALNAMYHHDRDHHLYHHHDRNHIQPHGVFFVHYGSFPNHVRESPRKSKEYWHDIYVQRSFLDELAKKLGITCVCDETMV